MGYNKNTLPSNTKVCLIEVLMLQQQTKGADIFLLHRILLTSVYAALLMYYTMSKIEINHGKFLSIIISNILDISLKLSLNHFVKGNKQTSNILFSFQKINLSTSSSIINNGQEISETFISWNKIRPPYINMYKIKWRSTEIVIERKR